MTPVDDMANGMATIVESKERHLIVNITTEESVSVLDMVKYAKEALEQ